MGGPHQASMQRQRRGPAIHDGLCGPSQVKSGFVIATSHPSLPLSRPRMPATRLAKVLLLLSFSLSLTLLAPGDVRGDDPPKEQPVAEKPAAEQDSKKKPAEPAKDAPAAKESAAKKPKKERAAEKKAEEEKGSRRQAEGNEEGSGARKERRSPQACLHFPR